MKATCGPITNAIVIPSVSRGTWVCGWHADRAFHPPRSLDSTLGMTGGLLHVNFVLCRDFALAAEHGARELAELVVVARAGTHRLAGIGEARHLEHGRERLERYVADLLFIDVVKAAIERDQLCGREIGLGLVRQ